jgi:hypothetical protein
MNKKLRNTNQIALIFIATFLLISCNNSTIAQTSNADSTSSVENKQFFTCKSISEIQFREVYKNNYNATLITQIDDTTKFEKALEAIEKTYNDSEKELAGRELCETPRCLTSFKAYYPTLDLFLFNILDYHYSKAIFVFANSNEMASGYRRFRGEYGVMSKDGLWVGLERRGSDNFLQLEICKSSKNGVWTLFSFDFTYIDISEEEQNPMFWADKNTIYIASLEYDNQSDQQIKKYYSINFEYE